MLARLTLLQDGLRWVSFWTDDRSWRDWKLIISLGLMKRRESVVSHRLNELELELECDAMQ